VCPVRPRGPCVNGGREPLSREEAIDFGGEPRDRDTVDRGGRSGLFPELRAEHSSFDLRELGGGLAGGCLSRSRLQRGRERRMVEWRCSRWGSSGETESGCLRSGIRR